jgi:electron transfer flavoprotein beta subunit
MNIVVCMKMTPDAGDIEVKADGSISLERAEWGLGSFDLQALEAGMRLVDAFSGKVTALSAGPQQIANSKLKKDLLSRGPHELVLVVDESLKQADTGRTASVLAQAVRKLGDVDLVLCGEGSSDLYFQQVGLQLGERLGWPTLNAISKIEEADGKLRVERSLEDEVEVLEVALPAVLSVTTDITPATRLPSMKDILTASKKPVTEWSLVDLGAETLPSSQVEVLSVRAPQQVQRKHVLLSGSPEEAAQSLLEALGKEGLV